MLWGRSFTKPGCIAPGPVQLHNRHRYSHVAVASTNIVRPFRVSQSQPPTPRASISTSASTVDSSQEPLHPHDPPLSRPSVAGKEADVPFINIFLSN